MRLGYMRPARSVNNTADVATLQPEIVCNNLMRFAGLCALANRAYQRLCQRGSMMFLTLFATMGCHLLHIDSTCAPVQVAQRVVTGIPIAMAGLFSWRAWANKRFKHKMVDVTRRAACEDDQQAVIVRAWRAATPRLELSPGCSKPPTVIMLGPDRAIRPHAIARMICDVFVDDVHMSIIS